MNPPPSLSSFLLAGVPAAASPADELAVSGAASSAEWFAQIFGVGMWPLWILSVVLVTLIFERAKVMRRHSIIDSAVIDKAVDLLSYGRTREAIAVLEASPARLCQAWAQGLRVFERGREPLASALTTTSTLALKPLKKNIAAISTIGVIAPLLGLLGTVIGMVIAFGQIAATGGADKAALAGGISFALFTTVGGLIIAIPAIVSGRYFSNTLIGYAEEIELAINRADYVYPHEGSHRDVKKEPDESPAAPAEVAA